jgi:hypothetical protein
MLSTTLFVGIVFLVGVADDPTTTTIKGTVSLQGKAVSNGKITFFLDNDQFIGAKVKDGQYTVERVPPGRWKVTVEGEGVPIKWVSDRTTPLVIEVTASQAPPGAYDIHLQ